MPALLDIRAVTQNGAALAAPLLTYYETRG
jgi:hypothetical protein